MPESNGVSNARKAFAVIIYNASKMPPYLKSGLLYAKVDLKLKESLKFMTQSEYEYVFMGRYFMFCLFAFIIDKCLVFI